MNFDDFLKWETATRDTIDFKKAYVDMAGGDLVAGLLLSQIVYWHLPTKAGESRLRVWREGYQWIAKGRADWWDEARITPKQFDRACQVLVDLGLVVKANFRFSGLKMIHLRLDQAHFMELWQATLTDEDTERGKSVFPKGQNRSTPKGKTDIPERVIPLTETTTETTPVIVDLAPDEKNALDALQALGFEPVSVARRYAQAHPSAQVLGWVRYAQAEGLGPGWVRKALDAGEPAPGGEVEPEEAKATPAELATPQLTLEEAEALGRWGQVLDLLQGRMTRATFDAWLRGSTPLSWEDGQAVIGVRSPFAVEWLTNRLKATIDQAAAQALGQPVVVTFESLEGRE